MLYDMMVCGQSLLNIDYGNKRFMCIKVFCIIGSRDIIFIYTHTFGDIFYLCVHGCLVGSNDELLIFQHNIQICVEDYVNSKCLICHTQFHK